MTTGGSFDVVVVGSANVDLSIPVERLPEPGQTVLGGDTLRGGGGKGANQAVAAARLGARVALIGRVGDDDDGRWLRDLLDADGVDVRALFPTRGVPTGLAVVVVDADGENAIVVSSGANGRVRVSDLDAASSILDGAGAVLAQFELPLATVAAVPARCSGRRILNPAPAQRASGLAGFDIVVPNRGELAVLAGDAPATDPATLVDQARSLDAPVVVVTVGGQGAVVVFNDQGAAASGVDVVTVPAVPVAAVDTTAAGDSFCGALAVALVEGAGVEAATGWAVRVAGETVTTRGAQASLPRRRQVGHWGAPA
ncbi:MAG: ribokinase [Acidimicrobiales bacterium]